MLGGSFFPFAAPARLVATVLTLAAFGAFVLFWIYRRATDAVAFVPPVFVGVLLAFDYLDLPSTRLFRTCVLLPAVLVYGALFTVAIVRNHHAVRALEKDTLALEERMGEKYEAQHRTATRTVLERRRLGRPFVLFLRSFDLEALSLETRGKPALHHRVRIQSGIVDHPTETIEGRVADALRGRAPVMAVANPVDTLSWFRTSIPMLELPHENWQGVVRALIESAEVILMALSSITPGVTGELEMMLDQNAQDRAVVILVAGEPDPLLASVARWYGVDPPDIRPASSDAVPALRRFPHVLDGMLPGQFEDHPVFADLLRRLESAASAARGGPGQEARGG